MEKFEVTILGCGSALPTMKHMNSSQIVNMRNKLFMIDCGEGTQLTLRRNRVNFNRITTIFLSHLHGDHCLGLTGMVSTMGLLGRTAPLHIYGPSDTEKVFRPHIDYFCPNIGYEVHFHSIDTTTHSLVYENRSVEVYSIPLKHRVACCGFLFREKPGLRHILDYMIERHEIPYSQINNIKKGMDYVTPSGERIPNEELTTPPDPIRSYAYCSDTKYDEDIIPYIKDVDLLYHEATYTGEYADQAAQRHHSTAAQAARCALEAGAGKLLIGHYSSRIRGTAPFLAEAQAVFPDTVAVEDGDLFDLPLLRP